MNLPHRRHSSHSLALLGSVCLLAVATPAFAQSTAPAEADAAADAVPNEEITVTARHRVEKLQDVPIAVTAVTSRDLEASGNSSLRQIQAQVPSLSILGFNPRNITIQIRGLGTTAGSVNSGIEPGVGVYVNGVYNARPSIAVFDVFDIASVNVLRGPQGTLFGKNTVAGVIDVQTNPASYTPEFNGEISYGNYDYSQVKVAASGPIGDTGFAVRIAGIKSDRNGTIYNTTFKNNWQDYHNEAVRGEIAYRNQDETFHARLIGDYNKQQQYSGFQVTRGVLPRLRNDGTVGVARDFYQRSADAGYVPLPIDPSARTIDLNTPFTVNMTTGGVSLELDKEIAGHTLTSITGWRFWNWNPSLDGDRTGAAITTASNLPTYQRQLSQELRIASPSGGALEYTAGLYYFHQTNREIPYNAFGADAAKFILGPTYVSAALDGVGQRGLYLATTDSYSAFANATWRVTDKIAVTGGVRYTYETRSGTYDAYQVDGLSVDDPNILNQTLTPAQQAAQRTAIIAQRNSTYPISNHYEVSAKGGQVSGTLNVKYNFTDDVNVYGGYSRGFKSAGINLAAPVQLASGPAPQTFAPEIVDAFEIGLKSQWFDRRLTVNLAAFLSTDKNYQANQSIAAFIGTSTTPVLRSYITNVGTVLTRGVELDLRARPIEGLTVGAAATYNDAHFKSYPNGACPYLERTAANSGVCDLTGKPVAGVSDFVFNLNAEYAVPTGDIFGSSADFYVGGDYNHRSSSYGALNDDPYSLIPAYGLANAYFGVRDQAGKWDLKVWGRNLFNKLYYVNASVDQTTTYTYAGVLGDPRYYGVTLRLKL
ncbi:MAG TPA: TonB-dependent receptor [Sphingobium sp.]